jgi:hypothetical protein
LILVEQGPSIDFPEKSTRPAQKHMKKIEVWQVSRFETRTKILFLLK